MLKLEVIVEVHQLKKQRLKISAIARKIILSSTTVYEYLELDSQGGEPFFSCLNHNVRKSYFSYRYPTWFTPMTPLRNNVNPRVS